MAQDCDGHGTHVAGTAVGLQVCWSQHTVHCVLVPGTAPHAQHGHTFPVPVPPLVESLTVPTQPHTFLRACPPPPPYQVGVAKDANVVAVRILDCTGSGTISDTVAGLDWVAANHKSPAIVTLSLGIQVGAGRGQNSDRKLAGPIHHSWRRDF